MTGFTVEARDLAELEREIDKALREMFGPAEPAKAEGDGEGAVREVVVDIPTWPLAVRQGQGCTGDYVLADRDEDGDLKLTFVGAESGPYGPETRSVFLGRETARQLAAAILSEENGE